MEDDWGYPHDCGNPHEIPVAGEIPVNFRAAKPVGFPGGFPRCCAACVIAAAWAGPDPVRICCPPADVCWFVKPRNTVVINH